MRRSSSSPPLSCSFRGARGARRTARRDRRGRPPTRCSRSRSAARRSRPQARSRATRCGRGAAPRPRGRPQPARHGDAVAWHRLRPSRLPGLPRSAGREDRPRRPFRLCRGRRQRGDLRDRPREGRIVERVYVGRRSPHVVQPGRSRLWIALSEVATTIVRLDTSDLSRPRISLHGFVRAFPGTASASHPTAGRSGSARRERRTSRPTARQPARS